LQGRNDRDAADEIVTSARIDSIVAEFESREIPHPEVTKGSNASLIEQFARNATQKLLFGLQAPAGMVHVRNQGKLWPAFSTVIFGDEIAGSIKFSCHASKRFNEFEKPIADSVFERRSCGTGKNGLG
jgi:hypothetical protein